MKKWKILLVGVLTILIGSYNVSAKDTVHSINKYQEETLTFIKNSYNKDGKLDGFITGGHFLKEEKEVEETTYKDYQIMLVKYKKTGEIAWTYSYGKNKEDKLQGLQYTVDSEGKIDGYLLVLEKTYDIVDDTAEVEETPDSTSNTTFLKIGLDGKLVWEKDSALESQEQIQKMVPTHTDGKTTGYIAIGYQEENLQKKEALIIYYDTELNLQWKKEDQKEEHEIEYTDIVPIQENHKEIGYAIIRILKNTKKEKFIQLLRFDLEGNENAVILDSLNKYDSYYLERANDGFLFYGITPEVKIKKSSKSFFVINYNSQNQEAWETIGDVPVNKEKKIMIHALENNQEIEKYYLAYGNESDNSFEVVEMDIEGNMIRKVKKIINDYYDYESFCVKGKKLYFVGQINCPEDDNCEYDANSLFLISDEDTVIEVKDNDSKNILIGMGIFLLLIIMIVLIRRKKRLQ